MTKQSLAVATGSTDATGALLLLEAAAAAGFEASLVIITEPDAAERINEADFAVYRVAPRTFSRYKEMLALLNESAKSRLAHVLTAFDKLETYEALVREAVPTPQSSAVSRDDVVGGFPKVVKILNGNQGIGVGLVHSDEEFEAFKREFAKEPLFLIQEYVEESKGSDKRLFVIGNQVVGAMKRVSQSDDFRANLHLGGKMESYAPSEPETAHAIAAVKALGLKYAGVDIIDSHRGPLVLEVNSSPGFGVQQVTSIDLPAAVIKEITKSE